MSLFRNRRTLAALVMTLAMVLIVLLPFLIVGLTLAENIKELTQATRHWIGGGPPAPPAWLIKVPVLSISVPLGLRWGALTGAFLLFAPPLALLGASSPWLLRIAAREVKNLGRTAGVLYALSTFGSFAGTLAAGFFLIGVLGVDRIFQLTGATLIALAVGYFVRYRRRWAVALAHDARTATSTSPPSGAARFRDVGTPGRPRSRGLRRHRRRLRPGRGPRPLGPAGPARAPAGRRARRAAPPGPADRGRRHARPRRQPARGAARRPGPSPACPSTV